MFYKMWAGLFFFTAVAAFADPAAGRTEGVTTHYYPTLNEAFEAAAGTSIDTPDEITILSDIILDQPIIIDTPKHIRIVAANGSKTIQRGSANLGNPLFRLLGNSASLTMGKPGMEGELVIDGGYLNTPPIQARAPLIAVNGQGAKLIMYDNVFLQNNCNSGSAVGTSIYQNGAGVMIRTVDDDTVNLTEFIMKGGTISGNIRDTKNDIPKGGGVLITGFGLFTMEGGIIMNNTAVRSGGGFSTGSRGSFKKTGGIIYGSDAPAGFRNRAINGIGPNVFGHAVEVALPDDPLFQFRDDTVGENDFLSYTGSPTENGVFGQGEKWDKPKPDSRPWWIIVIASVLTLGNLVFFLIFRRKQQPIPAGGTAAIEPEAELTPREKEIFDQLLTDISIDEIAQNLELTYSGVTFHIRNLYSKLRIQSRVELVAKYIRKIYVNPPHHHPQPGDHRPNIYKRVYVFFFQTETTANPRRQTH
ncbi:MAG: helix-turn-helix transcriptional regulator [Treponema sp.]|jgi:DNA-binding CsgD family transcriptional regulator|nr:helix-turn-helix transcriptional regulator [Treponema sp.]